ncbi:MAG TPA: hypothetical protein VE172_02215 [Stackebrandtia sp.]|uniref:hypothetical protein n=1 Tax=Stackebrandtia sp. TaxID=2023065 RepID=UPI002D249598|nr:hypothetical protein [Stackebrandtia sp.]HZE37601.1 hypothetical protein [Stackebrandtia sp.]
MPQIDLIVETYVHAPAAVVAPRVADRGLAAALWPQWMVRVGEERGLEGIRWSLDDTRVDGSTEVWIQRLSADGCVLHAFARVDRRAKPWSGWRAAWLSRRTRTRMSTVLMSLKDDCEAGCG